jgi:hypothetical protein
MVSDLSFFHSYTKVSSFFKLPDDKLVPVHHIGSIYLKFGLLISHVLHVPSFKFKLLSISKLSRDTNSRVILTSTSCLLQDQMTKKISVIGEQHGGLYLMDHFPTTFYSAVSFGSHFDLWHWRLGHPAPTLSSNFSNIDFSIEFSNKCSYTVCPLAKQTHL